MPPKRKANSKGDAVSKRPKASDDNSYQTNLITDTLFFTDVVSVLFSFLDVRHLLKFVSVSKEFQARLAYDHVVRAALISGGFPQTSLERMIRPIRDRQIWVPTPLRLLRVVCGKRCEACNQPQRYVCESFAVFLCNGCLEKSTKMFRKSKQWKPYLESSGILLGPRKGPRKPHVYMLETPMTDKSGNKIGPLVTASDVEAMESSNKDESKTLPSEKVAALIKECNVEQPHAESARASILAAVGDNRQEAEERLTAMKQEKKEIAEKNLDAKRKKCDQVLEKLMAYLKDPDLIAKVKDREWILLSKEYRFKDSVVQKILQKALRAPSKLNKKKLQEVADELEHMHSTKKLGLLHIQTIIGLVMDHPDAKQVLRYEWANWKMCWRFPNTCIAKILEEPIKNPKSLTKEDLEQLASQAKMVVARKPKIESILRSLEDRLQGLEYACLIKDRSWSSYTWCYKFTEKFVQEILYEPLLSPQDITDEKLDELARQLCDKMAQVKR